MGFAQVLFMLKRNTVVASKTEWRGRRIVKKFLTAAGLCSRLDTEEKLSDTFKMPREKDRFAYIFIDKPIFFRARCLSNEESSRSAAASFRSRCASAEAN